MDSARSDAAASPADLDLLPSILVRDDGAHLSLPGEGILLLKAAMFSLAMVSLAAGAAGVCYPQSAGTATSPPAATTEEPSNPKVLAELRQAWQLEQRQQSALAIGAYKKANKLAGGSCVVCLSGLYRAQMQQGDFKEAIRAAAAMQAAGASPLVKSVAAYNRGRALMALGGNQPKPAQLEQARSAYSEAVQLDPQNVSALFNEGEVLARMGRRDEAQKDFQLCLRALRPGDPAWLRVKHFADDPELAVQKMAPAFEVTALNGSRFNLDAMAGKVVLIDFWATWCGPCNRDLPYLKKIAREFAGQPLVMISVSLDSNAAAWREFVQKHEMSWLQYRDADHQLAREFGVTSIPHYFTIDSDGVLASESLGSGSNLEGRLRDLIARAEQAGRQRAAATAPAAPQTP